MYTSCVTIIEVKVLYFLGNPKIIFWELGIEIVFSWELVLSLTHRVYTPCTVRGH
jgi:hypothetical protein